MKSRTKSRVFAISRTKIWPITHHAKIWGGGSNQPMSSQRRTAKSCTSQGRHFILFVGGGGGWLHIFPAENILPWQKLEMLGTGAQFP